jgi:hypothetical protein
MEGRFDSLFVKERMMGGAEEKSSESLGATFG